MKIRTDREVLIYVDALLYAYPDELTNGSYEFSNKDYHKIVDYIRVALNGDADENKKLG